MLAKIKLWAAAVVAGIIAVFTIFIYGKNKGKAEQEVKQTKEVLEDVKKAKKVSSSAISSDAALKLSKRYSHKQLLLDSKSHI